MALTLTTDYPWQPSMHPVCYLCGAAPRKNRDWPDGEPIVHTGKYIEMEGFLHICGSCWTEGARLLGWLPPVERTAQEQDRETALRQRVKDLEDHIRATRELMEEAVRG